MISNYFRGIPLSQGNSVTDGRFKKFKRCIVRILGMNIENIMDNLNQLRQCNNLSAQEFYRAILHHKSLKLSKRCQRLIEWNVAPIDLPLFRQEISEMNEQTVVLSPSLMNYNLF